MFTYSGNPANSKLDWVRFMIGDTNINAPLLQDAEINFLIDEASTDCQLLFFAFRQAAVMFSIKAAKRSLGPQSEDTTARLKFFEAMAKKYEILQSYSGTPPLPDYQADKVFEKGMMANV